MPGVRAKAQDDFNAIGLTLKSFYIANLKPSDKSAEDLRAMGMLDMDVYTQLQAADALRDAAKNPSGGAGLTAGIGAGMGLGERDLGIVKRFREEYFRWREGCCPSFR